MKPEVTIYGFNASDNIEYCEIFSAGRDKVLHDHGFSGVVSNDDYWHGSETVYVFLAFDQDNLPTGGIRIEKKIKGSYLDLEKKLMQHQSVLDFVSKYDDYVVGEACGLWNSKNAMSLKLAMLFAQLVAAIAPLLGYDKIFSFSSTYTYRLARNTGAYMIKEVGDKGVFDFPSKKYQSSIFLCDDLETYGDAPKKTQERMFSLRENPNQIFIENNIPDGLKVNYKIDI